MTKKDYELIAKGFNNAFEVIMSISGKNSDITHSLHAGIYQAIKSVGLQLQKDNPKFNTDKFEKACEGR